MLLAELDGSKVALGVNVAQASESKEEEEGAVDEESVRRK